MHNHGFKSKKLTQGNVKHENGGEKKRKSCVDGVFEDSEL
jgi:hypothetical protein